LETGDAGYAGGVAGACMGSASFRRVSTAACFTRAAQKVLIDVVGEKTFSGASSKF